MLRQIASESGYSGVEDEELQKLQTFFQMPDQSVTTVCDLVERIRSGEVQPLSVLPQIVEGTLEDLPPAIKQALGVFKRPSARKNS